MSRFLLFTVFVFLLIGGCALAAGQTNPYLAESRLPSVNAQSLEDAASIKITLKANRTSFDSCDVDGVWVASACYVTTVRHETKDENGRPIYTYEDIESPGSFEFRFFLTAEEEHNLETHAYQPFSSSNRFTYDFVVPGEYELWVYAMDKNGEIGVASYEISVSDPDALTEQQRIAQIVADCEADGCKSDYEKALWLHDWLTDNAIYDSSLTYYSSDAVLVRGTGVCDSYSKAYKKLCNAAGVECEYFPSVAMGHSWNRVKMDGNWYFVDVTWDDPVVKGNNKLTSGYESHVYFGLPDSLLKFDHVYSGGTDCTSCECNYFIKSNRVKSWSTMPALSVQSGLDDSFHSFSFSLSGKYLDENGMLTSTDYGIVYGLAAYDLSRRTWTSGGQQYKIAATYDWNKKCVSVSLQTDSIENLLMLPSGLQILGDEAFIDCDQFMNVYLANSSAKIGKNSYPSNVRVWTAK